MKLKDLQEAKKEISNYVTLPVKCTLTLERDLAFEVEAHLTIKELEEFIQYKQGKIDHPPSALVNQLYDDVVHAALRAIKAEVYEIEGLDEMLGKDKKGNIKTIIVNHTKHYIEV